MKKLLLVALFLFAAPSLAMAQVAPTVAVTSPNGGETLTVGSVVHVTWNSTNSDKVMLGYSDCPSCLNWITSIIPNTGSYDWTVNVGNGINTQFKIYVIAYKTDVGSVFDYSDNYFTVNPANTTTTTSTTGTVAVTPVSTGTVTVSSSAQPMNSLAIQGASVPFTRFILTAGSTDVTVSGIKAQRTGLGDNSTIFSSVALFDDSGTQYGSPATFSGGGVTVGGTFVLRAGMSKTFTVVGNMMTSIPYAGVTLSILVTGISTTATVSGALPIVGATHTINGTLTVGTATGSYSSYDPGTTAIKAIGTTGYKFTGIRLTAGQVEDVRLQSIRFYQSGSASASDISNVKANIDGSAYDTTVSSDGKYYSVNFTNMGLSIIIARGTSKDIYISGDITGSGSAGRTVDFDIQKNTDVVITGETYAQGIIVGGTITTSTPALNGFLVTVVQPNTQVTTANFLKNLKLGDIDPDVKMLQQVLNSSADTQVASTGVGSPGMESTTFDLATKSAVIKFQNKYASEILAPIGLTMGNGIVDASTRAKLNMMPLTATVSSAIATPLATAVPGCTSTVGFSPITGKPCAVGSITATQTTTITPIQTIATQPLTDQVGHDTQVQSGCVDLQYNMSYRSRDAKTNGEVSDLQDFLVTSGYLSVEPTGYLGLMTVAAVKKFQAAVLGATSATPGYGGIGPKSRARIKEMTCSAGA